MYIINVLSEMSWLSIRRVSLFFVAILMLCYAAINSAMVSSIAMGANVPSNCMFTGGTANMNFGSYDPSHSNVATPLNTSTTFTLRCSKGSSAVISLSDGLYAQGNVRRLRGGNDYYLAYNLFKDAAHNTIWNTASTVNYAASSSTPKTFTIYGQVPPGQENVGVGSYSDTITINVTF